MKILTWPGYHGAEALLLTLTGGCLRSTSEVRARCAACQIIDGVLDKCDTSDDEENINKVLSPALPWPLLCGRYQASGTTLAALKACS